MINFQIYYSFIAMLKTREEFPTSLKYKFYILSMKFPQHFKESPNAKPLTQETDKQLSILVNEQDNSVSSHQALNNLGISSILKNKQQPKNSGQSNISGISSVSEMKKIISNIKDKDQTSNLKNSKTKDAEIRKIKQKQKQIIKQQQQQQKVPSSISKKSSQKSPQIKQQKDNTKNKEDLLVDDSDEQQEINRRRLQKINKSRGRINVNNDISTQSVKQNNKSNQIVNKKLDQSIHQPSTQNILNQIKQKEGALDAKIPPKLINSQMQSKQQNIQDKPAQVQVIINDSPTIQQTNQPQKVRQEQLVDYKINENNGINQPENELNNSKNFSQNDANIQITIQEDQIQLDVKEQPPAYYKNVLVQRFLSAYKDNLGRSWTQQPLFLDMNQPKQRKIRIYQQPQQQQEEPPKSGEQIHNNQKFKQLEQNMQQIKNNYELVCQKLSKYQFINTLQERINKIQVINNILSSQNRELKIQMNNIKDRLVQQSISSKKKQQKITLLQIEVQGLKNQIVNLGNNLFERQVRNSQIMQTNNSK